MHDLGIVDHASVKVALGGCQWLVDSSALCNVPLPLSNEVFIHGDPVFAAEVEPEDSTHIIWVHTPPNSTPLPCRLSQDFASHAFYLSKYEESRARSPFNQRLYARRNLPAEMLVLLANTRISKTAEGVVTRDLSPDELCEALRRDIGLSEDLIDEWAARAASPTRSSRLRVPSLRRSRTSRRP